MSNQKVVLITGASSGVGQATARLLSQKAFKVFGTTCNPTGVKAIPTILKWSLPDGLYEQGKRSTFWLDRNQ